MAEAVFADWLAQRQPDAANDVNSIRSSAQKFASRRLDSAADVKRVTQMALDHLAPMRSVRGRPAMPTDVPVTPMIVATLWLAGNTDVLPQNIPRIVRNFAMRKGLDEVQASDAVRLVVQELNRAKAPPHANAPPGPPKAHGGRPHFGGGGSAGALWGGVGGTPQFLFVGPCSCEVGRAQARSPKSRGRAAGADGGVASGVASGTA